jgi:hypothetical protein
MMPLFFPTYPGTMNGGLTSPGSLKAGKPFAALCSAHHVLALTRFIFFLAFLSEVIGPCPDFSIAF